MISTFLAIGVLQFAAMLVMVVRAKFLAVLLGPALVGVMGVIDKLVGVVAQTLSFSIPFAALRFLPPRWAESPNSYADLFQRMRNFLAVSTFAGALCAIAVTFVRPSLWDRELVGFRAAAASGLLTIPVVAFIPFLQNAFAGKLQHNRAVLVGLAHSLAMAGAVAGVALGGLTGYYLAYALLGGALAVWLGKVLARRSSPLPNPTRFPCRLPREIYRFGASLLLLSFATPFSIAFVQYSLFRSHGAAASGLMQAALGIAIATRTLLGSTHALVLTPSINRLPDLHSRLEWANAYLGTFCIVCGLGMSLPLLFPDLFLGLLYSPEFEPAATALWIFLAAEVVALIAAVYQALVIAEGRMRVHVTNALLAQLVIVLVAAAAVPRLGIYGAGLAGLAGAVTLALTTVAYVRRRYGIAMSGGLSWRCASLAAALGLASFLGATASGTARVALNVGAYAVLATAFLASMSARERAVVVEGLRRVLRQWRAEE